VDYELAAKAAHLTAVDKLSQSTHYLEKQEKEHWENLPESTPCLLTGMPSKRPFRDYPDAWKAYVSSEVLDKFIEEKSPNRPSGPFPSLPHSNWSSGGLQPG